MSQLSAIILAAGKGTRMKSPLPKVLHPVAGQPMIGRVLKAVRGCGVENIRVVVGYGEALLRQSLEPQGVVCCRQAEQKGTGDAVKAADPLSLTEDILILNGDHPLLTARQLKAAYDEFKSSNSALAVVTCELDNPAQFGRIVRHQGLLKAIVEAKDASAQTLAIKEINSGIFFVKKSILEAYLPKIQPHNEQNEYYFTDIVSLAIESAESVAAIKGEPAVAFGVNTQKELALAGKALYREKALQLMKNGVIIIDPENTYIEETVTIGEGSIVYPGSYLKGLTTIGAFTIIEPNTFIVDSQIGQSVQVRAGSYFEKAKVENKAVVGPYARLRPETVIGEEAKVGNFVEMKKVIFGKGAKASHLTYLGDAEVGEESNIGCGTITCNYSADKQKHKTTIGKNVFVGSDTQLVAPVQVGDDSIIASGTTVTRDVPAGSLAIGRTKQENKEDYAKRFKK